MKLNQLKRKFLFTFVIFIMLSTNKVFALADLVLTSVGFQQTTVDKGTLLVIQVTAKNQGNITSVPNYMLLFLSSDRVYATEETIGRVSIKQLAPNATQSITFVCSVPPHLIAGNFNVGFFIDPFNSVSEDNESNVFSATQLINVTNVTRGGNRIPYPIIFIHGLTSNSDTWKPFTHKADSTFGWIYGGRLDYCLNRDGNQSTSDNSILSFVDTNRLGKGDYYYLNFDIGRTGTLFVGNDGIPFNDDYSNQSAITKQGWAVKDAIRTVLRKTGTENVILVGHSMGGLASREYLQNSLNWQADGKHHVAKLLTIGTPHGGSNTFDPTLVSNLVGMDTRSEAVRDLRYPSVLFSGIYLFGGVETSATIYHNDDINCNGVVGDRIIGLNQKTSPNNVNYASIIGNWTGSSDGIVSVDRADLNNYLLAQAPLSSLRADRFTTASHHLNVHTENFSTVVKGLDEPYVYSLGNILPLNTLNYAFITEQATNNPYTDDHDYFKIKITQTGTLRVDAFNIPVQSFTASLLSNTDQLLQQSLSNAEANLTFSRLVEPGDYYIRFRATPTPNSYAYPYSFQAAFTPSVTNSTNDLEQKSVAYVYPNPNDGNFSLQIENSQFGNFSYSIINSLGQVCEHNTFDKNTSAHTVKVNSSNLTKGFYILKINFKTYSQIVKFVVN